MILLTVQVQLQNIFTYGSLLISLNTIEQNYRKFPWPEPISHKRLYFLQIELLSLIKVIKHIETEMFTRFGWMWKNSRKHESYVGNVDLHYAPRLYMYNAIDMQVFSLFGNNTVNFLLIQWRSSYFCAINLRDFIRPFELIRLTIKKLFFSMFIVHYQRKCDTFFAILSSSTETKQN